MNFIGIEKDDEGKNYIGIAKARIDYWATQARKDNEFKQKQLSLL
jgi:hypothetical protein